MIFPRLDTYAGITAVGSKPAVALPDVARTFALQVKGVGAAPTSWSVSLEGSLDGVNWTALVLHNASDGSTQWAVDKPVSFVRVTVGVLNLGTATSINVGYIACP